MITDGIAFQIEPGFHNCRQYRIFPAGQWFLLRPVHVVPLTVQNTFNLESVKQTVQYFCAYLLGNLIHTPYHTKLQAAAGCGVWEHYCPAASAYGPAVRCLLEEQKAHPEHIPGGEPVPSNSCGNSLHPESDLIAFIPKWKRKGRSFRNRYSPETFSPLPTCQWEAGPPEPHLFSLPGDSADFRAHAIVKR